MIRNRVDYLEYLRADEQALGVSGTRWINRIVNPIYRFEYSLRKYEYMYNCYYHTILKPIVIFIGFRHRALGCKLGFTIPINVFDKGLSIAHIGTIVVNAGAKVGKNCRIHTCTNIGVSAGTKSGAPILGNNVYIGPGAKIFGNIVIADNVAIGANAVVNKSFETSNITIAGIPAKKVSNKGAVGFI